MLGSRRAARPRPAPSECGLPAESPPGTPDRTMHLDRHDRALLNLVQEDATLTAAQLAARVPLSESAIQRRLRRLRDDGVIVRDVAVVDPQRAGAGATFVAALELAHERPESLARLRAWIAAEPRVQQAFFVTGGADFLLVVTAPDVAAYEAMMSGLVDANPGVRRYTTHVVLRLDKRGLTVPLPERDDGD